MKVNLNDMVKVKLTKAGIQVLAKQHQEMVYLHYIQGGKYLDSFTLRLDEEGYYTTQLWMLLDRFSEHMGLAKETVFENNDLYFLEENRKDDKNERD